MGFNQHKDLVPTVLELADINTSIDFDGQSLMKLVRGEVPSFESEVYLTECTWMRKHGLRTPQWKLIVALEPDFHFKPEVELYNLIEDPLENANVADSHPDVVETATRPHERLDSKTRGGDGPAQPHPSPRRLARTRRRGGL